MAETGQTEEGDILNRRAKHNVSRWREDPAPDKLSGGWRRGEAAVETSRRESFSMLGTRGRQASEENGGGGGGGRQRPPFQLLDHWHDVGC